MNPDPFFVPTSDGEDGGKSDATDLCYKSLVETCVALFEKDACTTSHTFALAESYALNRQTV